nr:protein transport protein SEC16B homolog [Ipomoea trifida]
MKDGTPPPGVKEVGWSAFNAVPGSNGDSGFGSYSDFFTVLGEGSGDAEENVNIEPKIVSADQVPDSAYLSTSNSGMVFWGCPPPLDPKLMDRM